MFQSITYAAPPGWQGPLEKLLKAHGIQGAYCAAPQGTGVAAAAQVARAIDDGCAAGGILLGPWGLEGSLVGNKFPGVRASVAANATAAMYTRCHNASNMLCLGTELLGRQQCLEITERWLTSEFEGGRHAISVGMIQQGEPHQFGQGGGPAMRSAAWPARRVWVGNDHAGYEAKAQVLGFLARKGIEAVDIGTQSTQIVRYPYYAARVAHAVLEGRADMGVLLCGTGIGMSIAANKFCGMRAALCGDTAAARAARQQFDANILCIGGKMIGAFVLEEVLEAWFSTPAPCTAQATRAALAQIEAQNGARATAWQPSSNV